MRTQKTTLCLSIRNWSAVNIYTSSTANEEEEKRKMFHEMQAEIRTLQNDVEKAKTTNKELIHYTEHLQRAPQDYKGKDIYSSKEKVKDFEDCHDKSSDSTVVC